MQLYARFSRFVSECRRVLKITRKPTWPEYTMLAKVTGLGILVIGMLGFVLTIVVQLTTLYFR